MSSLTRTRCHIVTYGTIRFFALPLSHRIGDGGRGRGHCAEPSLLTDRTECHSMYTFTGRGMLRFSWLRLAGKTRRAGSKNGS